LATSDRHNLARLSIAGVLAVCAAYAGCTVESHTFVDDSLFNLDSGTGNTGGGAQGGTGGTGAGGTGGGPGGSGGTGSGTGNENCTNGQDDDNDSQIDCADSDCLPLYACVPPVPAGWQGPVAFYEGTDAAPLCNASGGFPTQKQSAHSGIVPGTATCPTCACNFTGTPECKANLVFGSTADCQGGSCWGSQTGVCNGSPITATNGICQGIGLCQNGATKPTSLEITSASVTGTCTVNSTGSADIPAPGWTNEVRACGDAPATGKGCGTDGACMPVPTTPFSNSACIYKTGDTSCPSPFSNKHVVHQNAQDTRSCTPCGCGALAGGNCTGGTVNVYPAAGCGSGAQAATIGACNDIGVDPSPNPAVTGQCESPPGTPNAADSRSVLYSGATVAGTPACPPTGGQVSGAATAIDPITFCCL
jgi:hypothetical protein